MNIQGVNYRIDAIGEPSSNGFFLEGDNTQTTFSPGSESNLDVVFLIVSSGGTTRRFIIPNDRFGDMNVQAVRTGGIQNVGGSDAAVIGTTNNNVQTVCFAAGTLIEGPNGVQTPVERMAHGDLVQTADHRLQEVRWIGCRKMTGQDLVDHPHLQPIRIARGSLGDGQPEDDLVVSPQHRVMVRSRIASRMYGEEEVLLPAKFLLGLDGVSVDAKSTITGVVYYHILFDRHEIVFANGCEAESLHTGPEALKSLPADAICEIRTLFPELNDIDYRAIGARTFAEGAKGRRLIERHAKNDMALCAHQLH